MGTNYTNGEPIASAHLACLWPIHVRYIFYFLPYKSAEATHIFRPYKVHKVVEWKYNEEKENACQKWISNIFVVLYKHLCTLKTEEHKIAFYLNVCCVLVFYVFLCRSVCWFLYGPFCHGTLKLDISSLCVYNILFLNISSIYF